MGLALVGGWVGELGAGGNGRGDGKGGWEGGAETGGTGCLWILYSYFTNRMLTRYEDTSIFNRVPFPHFLPREGLVIQAFSEMLLIVPGDAGPSGGMGWDG